MVQVEVKEQFYQGKISDEQCEDVIVNTPDFIGIVDGVTSKSTFRFNGQTSGKLAATMIASILKNSAPEMTINQFVTRVNSFFAQFYEQVDFPYDKASQGLQAVTVVYSRHYHQLWQIGDAQINLDGQMQPNTKPSDDVLANFRSLILKTSGLPNSALEPQADPGRQAILPWLLKATQFANSADNEWGYAVLNGAPIPDALLKVTTLDDAPHEIALASDGYPEVTLKLASTEAALANVLANDPLCCQQYRSTKGLVVGNRSFDDRSYIRFETTPD